MHSKLDAYVPEMYSSLNAVSRSFQMLSPHCWWLINTPSKSRLLKCYPCLVDDDEKVYTFLRTQIYPHIGCWDVSSSKMIPEPA